MDIHHLTKFNLSWRTRRHPGIILWDASIVIKNGFFMLNGPKVKRRLNVIVRLLLREGRQHFQNLPQPVACM